MANDNAAISKADLDTWLRAYRRAWEGKDPAAAARLFAPDSRYASAGVFVQEEILAFDPFFLTAGVRFSYFDFSFDDFPSQGGEHVEGDFEGVTGSLQASRALGGGIRAIGTVSQGFRAPNLDDLAKNLEAELHKEEPKQLSLFSEDERTQLRRDKLALEARLRRIPEEGERERLAIEERHAGLVDHTFPVAVILLVPESLQRSAG